MWQNCIPQGTLLLKFVQMPAKLQRWWNKNIWDVRPPRQSVAHKSRDSNLTINGKFWDFLSGEGVDGLSVNAAQKLAAVYIALNIRSQTVAALPINIILEEGGKKTILTDHPAYEPLAHQPTSYMSSANMFLSTMLNADSWGNAYLHILRDGRTRPRGFEIMCAPEVSQKIVEGQAFYGYEGETIPGRDVLHFRWFSLDGFYGISPIRQNAMTMGMAAKQEKYSGMALGERPPGFLKYEGQLKPEQRAQNQESWIKDRQMGKTPILSGNWDWKNVMISPGDAEYILSKKLTKQEIYGIYRIPPTFAQDFERATFSNAEQSDLVFAKHTVVPIVRVIEQECNLKLFTEAEKKNTFTKFNLNGLLRGDLNARQAFYTAMRNIGGMNANEIRSLEDMNEYQGGEIFTIQSANIPVDQLRDFYIKQVEPTATNNPVKPRINGHTHEILN